MNTMQAQAATIESVFHAFGVPAEVASPPRSFRASSYHSFGVERRPDVKVSKVTALAPELNEALGVPVRFDDMPLSIEVQRPDPQILQLIDLWPMLTKSAPATGLPMVSGQGVINGRLSPALINLAHPNTPHALVAGTTGSGKTALLCTLILSAAVMRGPAQLAMVVIDPKAVGFRTLYGLPHLAAPIVTEATEGVAALRAVVGELERRKSLGMSEPDKRILVVIDELVDLMAVAGPEVEALLQRINQVGRELGIHVIAATQHPTAAAVGSVLKANFPVRIVGRVNSADDAKVAIGVYGSGAESLPGMGSFLVRNGRTHRIQAYHAGKEEHGAIIAQIARRWDNARPHYALRMDAPPARRVESRVVMEIESDAPGVNVPTWLVPAIRKYVVSHGKPPSQRKINALVQKRTGKMLPWPLVKAALQSATQAQRNGEMA